MLFLVGVSLLLVMDAQSGVAESGYDALVDVLLINLNKDLNGKSMCNISLSELKFEVSHSLFYLFPMDVEVYARNGSVAQICTLKRTGDVMLRSSENDTVTLGLNLGLGSLSVYFADVEAYALAGLYSDDFGSLRVEPSTNAIALEISLTYPRTLACSTSLDSLTVSLGNLTIWLDGKLDADLEKTADVDMTKFSAKINSAVEKKLLSVLNSYDICNKITSL